MLRHGQLSIHPFFFVLFLLLFISSICSINTSPIATPHTIFLFPKKNTNTRWSIMSHVSLTDRLIDSCAILTVYFLYISIYMYILGYFRIYWGGGCKLVSFRTDAVDTRSFWFGWMCGWMELTPISFSYNNNPPPPLSSSSNETGLMSPWWMGGLRIGGILPY